MKRERVKISDQHHVVRLCKRKSTIRENGTVIGVFPDAFLLRPKLKNGKPEAYLSTSYYEFFDGGDDERLSQCLSALGFTPDSNDAMARVNAGKAREQGKKHNRSLQIMHERSHPTNAAYASISGLPIEPSIELAQAIIDLAVVSVRKVGDVR